MQNKDLTELFNTNTSPALELPRITLQQEENMLFRKWVSKSIPPPSKGGKKEPILSTEKTLFSFLHEILLKLRQLY